MRQFALTGKFTGPVFACYLAVLFIFLVSFTCSVGGNLWYKRHDTGIEEFGIGPYFQILALVLAFLSVAFTHLMITA